MKSILLRTKVLFFIFSFSFFIGKAQWVSIPDTNFGNWLHTNGYYDTCLAGNSSIGWSMDTTCPAVVNATSVNCMLSNIRDLTGISYFDNLQILTCDGNQLSSFPVLPAGLTALRCTQNQLSNLPELPTGLTELYCVYNQLTTLPILPTGLTILSCSHNILNRLPVLPGNLTSLSCNNNQLSYLPPLPDSLNNCNISDNPLNCLPQLKRIVTLNFANTNVTCLPNYGNITFSLPLLNTLPVCDLLNENGCEIYGNISGKVYSDENANCIADNDETDLINIPVQLRSNGALLQQMPSLGSGTFSFDTDPGTYEISVDTADIPFSVTCPSNNVYYDTITASDSMRYSRNFAVECKPGFDLLAAYSIEGRFRPGDTRKVDIHVGSPSNFYGISCPAVGSPGTELEFAL